MTTSQTDKFHLNNLFNFPSLSFHHFHFFSLSSFIKTLQIHNFILQDIADCMRLY